MKYITNVEINNFQSHKKNRLDFKNGLNVIVGPSDQGKTSIIRAIKWVLYNEPSGTFFIRHGANDVEVTLTFNSGEKLKRLRTPSKNLYIYLDEEGNEDIYEGFGLYTPKEISDKLNITKIYINSKTSNSITIGEQLECPFLLSEKSSTRANAIGRLVGVHIVDKAVQNTIKDSRNINIEKKNLTEEIDSLEKRLDQYNYLDSLYVNIETLESIYTNISDKENLVMSLKNISKNLSNNRKETNNLQNILKSLSSINNLEYNIDKLDITLSKLNNFYRIKDKLQKIAYDSKKNLNILDALEKIKYLNEYIKRLETNISNYKTLSISYKKYNNLLKELEKIQVIENNLKSIDYLSNSKSKLIKKIDRLNHLNKLSNSLNIISKSIKKGNDYLSNFNNISKIQLNYNTNENKTKKLNDLLYIQSKMSEVLKSKEKNKKEINILDREIKTLLENYKGTLSKLEKCPVCFNEIENKDLNRIINNLI